MPSSEASEEFFVVREADVAGYSDSPAAPSESELAELVAWLSPTGYAAANSELAKNTNAYTAHTGKWLAETGEYGSLFSSDDVGLLWIQGIPGSGKSVIAARLIAELGKDPLCYFFFREILHRNRTPRSAIRDWLAQLLPFSPSCATRLQELQRRAASVDSVADGRLWEVFTGSVMTMEKPLAIVVDALDEMDPAEAPGFLRDLVALVERKRGGIKVIATSRQNPILQKALRSPAVRMLKLDREKVDGDIGWYAEHRLQNAGIEEEKREGLVRELVQRGNGLFLYARLVLDEMLDTEDSAPAPGRHDSLTLTVLPQGISDMYAKLLEKHRAASGATLEQQIIVLQWVVYSAETQTLTQLADILNLPLGERGLDVPRLDAKALVRRICGPLLEVMEDETVQIVHHSFTEYLTNKHGVRPPASSTTSSFPILTATEAHKALVRGCLQYMTFPIFLQPGENLRPPTSGCIVWDVAAGTNARRANYPFLYYALRNWGHHARLAKCTEDDKDIFALIELHSKTEAGVYTQIRGDGDHQYPDKFQPLHIAAWFGLTGYAEYLLSQGAEIEAKDDENEKTPLLYAAAYGHLDTLELLERNGAQMDVKDSRGWTAVHYAAQGGQAAVVRKLIEFGVDVNSEGVLLREWSLGYPSPHTFKLMNAPPLVYTPMLLAIEGGRKEVVRELLPRLTEKDFTYGKKGKTILQAAAAQGQNEILKDIVDFGLGDIDAADSEGRTALIKAIVKMGNAETVRLLLKHGADPTHGWRISGEKNGIVPQLAGEEISVLHLCAMREVRYSNRTDADMEETGEALLAAGLDVNLRGVDGETPLFAAARGGRKPMVDWLLRHGADLNAVNSKGQIALHTAVDNRVFESLVIAGADINALDADGNTPLLSIATQSEGSKYGCANRLKFFISHGGNPYHVNKSGTTVLHAWGKGCLTELGEVEGLDLNVKDSRGRTPLHLFSYLHFPAYPSDDEEVIPKSVDLNVQDVDGCTALHIWIQRDLYRYNNVMELLKKGAGPLIKDNRGHSVMHALCHPTILKDNYNIKKFEILLGALIEKGVDVNATDNQGETVAHYIARWAHVDFLRLFLRNGLDPVVKNNKGEMAMHVAERGQSDVMRLLGTPVNATDGTGQSPLHAAARTCFENTQFLLGAGADPVLRDEEGRTPLHVAAERRNTNALYVLVESIKKKGLSVDALDESGRTPLHEAARSGKFSSVKILLDAGASVGVLDNAGRSPLHAAAEFAEDWRWMVLSRKSISEAATVLEAPVPMAEHCLESGLQVCYPQQCNIREVCRLLVKGGADIIKEDQNGHTPIQLALIKGDGDMYEELCKFITVSTDSVLKRLAEKPEATEVAKAFETHQKLKEQRKELESLQAQQGFDAALRWAFYSGNESGILELLRDLPDTGRGKSTRLELNVSQRLGPGNESTGDASKSDTSGEEKDPEIPFGRRVVRYVIREGWLSLLELVIQRFGFEDQDIFSIWASSDLNLHILSLLLPRMKDPNVRRKLPKGQSPYECKMDHGALIHRFCRGTLPWYPSAVRLLVEDSRIDVNARDDADDDGDEMPLHRALSSASFWTEDIARALLSRPEIDTNACTRRWRNSPTETPLILACKLPHPERYIRLLMPTGLDLRSHDPFPSVLCYPEAVELLLSAGANPHHPVRLLHDLLAGRAATDSPSSRLQTFHQLLSSGLVSINALTPLSLESAHTNHTAFDIFADAYDAEYTEPHTLLHHIAWSGCHKSYLPSILSVRGIDINARDHSGRTPLHVAAASIKAIHSDDAFEPLDVLPQLLAAGADINAVDNQGYAVLDYFFAAISRPSEGSRRQILDTLVSAGAVAAPSLQGTILRALNQPQTPLGAWHRVEEAYGIMWSVWRLLKHGIVTTVVDQEGNSPLHLFLPRWMGFVERPRSSLISPDTQEVYDEVFDILLSNGCDLNSKNSKGETPLYVALKRNWRLRADALKRVIERGVDIGVETNKGRGLLHAVARSGINATPAGEKAEAEVEEMKAQGCQVVGRREVFDELVRRGLDPDVEVRASAQRSWGRRETKEMD